MADIKNRRIRRGPQVEVLGPNLRKIDSGAQRGAKTAAHDGRGGNNAVCASSMAGGGLGLGNESEPFIWDHDSQVAE